MPASEVYFNKIQWKLYFCTVKKYNWTLGMVVSAGIAVMSFLPRLLREESFEWHSIISAIIYTFLFALFAWGAHSFLASLNKAKRLTGNRFLLGVISIVLVGLVGYWYDLIFSLFSAQPVQLVDVPYSRRVFVILLRGLMISWLYYFIVHYLQMLAEKQQGSIEIEQLKQARLQANLSSLKEQLSPHFLFNTLNALSSLSKEKAVKDYVNELSNVYRYVLQYKEANIATLQQELHFIESYLYIVKTRLENAIEISIEVDERLLISKIPPLTLQILIENAVKHNIAASYKPLIIKIYNNRDKELIVENNYQPKSSVSHSTGIGLENISQRYQLLFSQSITIEKSTESFLIKLPIIL